jgi:hypothetical protein
MAVYKHFYSDEKAYYIVFRGNCGLFFGMHEA